MTTITITTTTDSTVADNLDRLDGEPEDESVPEMRGLRRALAEAAAVLGCDPGGVGDEPIDPPNPIPGSTPPGRAAGLGRRLAAARALRMAA